MDDLADSLQSVGQEPADEGAQSSTKKLQREAECSKFKYKANAKQFIHNAEVEDLVTMSMRCLDRKDPNIQRAIELAKEAVSLIQRRQKLIKLADNSEAGWLVVEEYESDALAENSEDDKKIRKAQDKALRKKKQLQQTRVKRQ